MDTPPTLAFPHPTVARARATVTIPAVRRGPKCARVGCYWTAWFAVHHVPVCSSACAERLAAEGSRYAPVVRAVRWQAWTLVVASTGRCHDRVTAWWWCRGLNHQAGTRTMRRTVDVLTDAGLFHVLRYVVRTGADELRPWRMAGSVDAPVWVDIDLPQDPVVLARGLVTRYRRLVRERERVRALRARQRQRGVSQDGTRDQASRVA